jgi:phosphoribosyl-AMP cyclohydrolase
VFNLFGGAISWMSKRQVVVALSTTKVEYMASTHASKEAIWLKILCSGIRFVQHTIRLDCDSQNVMFLAINLPYHSKTKHIDV